MGWNYILNKNINLFVEGRILEKDAKRQQQSAAELLDRLNHWPGQILADEVGMGKTFIALAVATSVALGNKKKMPVVIMIPPILRSKWPKDLETFKEKCLNHESTGKINYKIAESTVHFLKLLDKDTPNRPNIIFVTHGAFNRSLGDNYVKLAIIQRALHKRKDTQQLRLSLARFGAQLLRLQRKEDQYGDIIDTLMNVDPSRWKNILINRNILTEQSEDPVPQELIKLFYEFDSKLFENLYHLLQVGMPVRTSQNLRNNLTEIRQEFGKELSSIWSECNQELNIKLPLLIIDEAHHLKNAKTKFASLFHSDENNVSNGQLTNVFERMLFLTATPFQLGHHELCNVMDRFNAITWNIYTSPLNGRENYKNSLRELKDKLDQAQKSAIRLDGAWEELSEEDLLVSGQDEPDVSVWWQRVKNGNDSQLNAKSQKVAAQFRATALAMETAQMALRPMVIRHLRSRELPDNAGKRRIEFSGKSILNPNGNERKLGLVLESKSLFPFLLAARLTAVTPESRPVFAEGLASSFEAFLHTRNEKQGANMFLDNDDATTLDSINKRQDYYLDEIKSFLKKNIRHSGQTHPKISATINKAVELWLQGEKVLIFCHYIATGKALRNYISQRMTHEINKMAARKIGCSEPEALDQLERIGERFDNGPLKDFVDLYVGKIIDDYDLLIESKTDLLEIVRRYLRTPSFLIRFFPLDQKRFDEDQIKRAFAKSDCSNQTFSGLLRQFFTFLNERCGLEERRQYISALSGIQTGGIRGKTAQSGYGQDELEGVKPETILPNVRLANGSIKDETRQKLMLTFNTPFYPDILIASSVMAEGVDLHLNCRYIIHHDLSWNPSTLEQRTGRVDRIGAKAEICKMPINIYYPYIAETQDEKMYKVVMDREKWFKVVMGENIKMDANTTNKLAERISFPEEAAEELSFKLDLETQV